MMNRVWMGVVWAFVLILPTGSAEAVEQLLPDLIAWESEERGFIHGWSIDTNEIPGRILLRLSSTIANIGAGPMEIRGGVELPGDKQEVFQRIYNDDNSFSDVLAGTFHFHAPHGHVHFDGFAQYNLREVTAGNGVGPILSDGSKTSFCLIDFTKYDLGLPGAPTVEAYDVCESTVQGISVGWADVYNYTLPDQWIDITDVSRDGDFWLEVVADPDNNLIESDETNNATRILITLGGPADFDGDGDMDATDLELLRQNFGDPAFDLDADLDADEDDVAYMVNVILNTVYGDA
ncbi:MAG: lysyl oxidase family protein, partial [Phycisphaeraceae bacterium]